MSVATGVTVPASRVDVAAGPRLIGVHCPGCGITAYPAFDLCPRCWQPPVDRVLSPAGVLYTYSVVHVGPRERPVPYTLGYIDLAEGARVFGWIDETDESRLRPDMRVQLELRRDGEEYLAIWHQEATDA